MVEKSPDEHLRSDEHTVEFRVSFVAAPEESLYIEEARWIGGADRWSFRDGE